MQGSRIEIFRERLHGRVSRKFRLKEARDFLFDRKCHALAVLTAARSRRNQRHTKAFLYYFYFYDQPPRRDRGAKGDAPWVRLRLLYAWRLAPTSRGGPTRSPVRTPRPASGDASEPSS